MKTTLESPKVTDDHFIMHHGKVFAGHHLILDLYGVQDGANQVLIEDLLRQMVSVSGATLLHMHVHQFSCSGGLSGVAVLAESHISFHTWPERCFMAFDIFMCGKAKPHLAAKLLCDVLAPNYVQQHDLYRGDRIQDELGAQGGL
jgi:S-adenosylmethionine decarboxylase